MKLRRILGFGAAVASLGSVMAIGPAQALGFDALIGGGSLDVGHALCVNNLQTPGDKLRAQTGLLPYPEPGVYPMLSAPGLSMLPAALVSLANAQMHSLAC